MGDIMNNARAIKNIISSFFIMGILIYFVFLNSSFQIVFLPFLLCVLISILKNIFSLFNLDKLVFICNKLYGFVFLAFWFCFLGYFCYISLKNHDIVSVLATSPFWFIGGCVLYRLIKE